MNTEHYNSIERLLEQKTPVPTDSEVVSMWRTVALRLDPRAPIPSFFHFVLPHTRVAVAAILLVSLVLSGGVTAWASDAARPGDALFPVDRALENVRLRLAASDASRTALREEFAGERITELRSIITETSVLRTPDPATDTPATTRGGERVDSRTSRNLGEGKEDRLAIAVDAMIGFADDAELSDDEHVHLLTGMFGEIDDLDIDVEVKKSATQTKSISDRVKIRRGDSGKSRIDVRSGEKRIRVEREDGEIRVRSGQDEDFDDSSDIEKEQVESDEGGDDDLDSPEHREDDSNDSDDED